MRVRDLMSRQVVTIGASDSCQQAAARMYGSRVRHLPVVDSEGMLVGIVTDRDLRHHLFTPAVYRDLGTFSVDTLLKAVPVSEVMSTPVVTAKPDEELLAAAQEMLEDKVGSLPVVQDGRVVGILTEIDLLRQICRTDEASSPECAEIVVSFP